jgi:hypothetical protein
MIDPKTALDATGAGLNLLNTVVKMIQTARENEEKLNIADVMERLPGEAFSMAGKVVNVIDEFRQDCLQAGIDLDRTPDQLLEETSFWRLKRYRVVKKFQPNVDAIAIQLETLLDDAIAVTHCRDADSLVAESYARARERKVGLRAQLNGDQSMGQILDSLKSYAQDLRAQLGDLSHLSGKKV